MMEGNSNNGPRKEAPEKLFGMPEKSSDIGVKPAIFTDADFIGNLRNEEYSVPGGVLNYSNEEQRNRTGLHIHQMSKAASPEDPRSFVASVGDTQAGYVLLGKNQGGHVEIEDLGVKKEFRRNPEVVEKMVDHLLSHRVGGEPLTYDAWAREKSVMRALESPVIHERVKEKGYEVVSLERKTTDSNETYHRISLRPIKE